MTLYRDGDYILRKSSGGLIGCDDECCDGPLCAEECNLCVCPCCVQCVLISPFPLIEDNGEVSTPLCDHFGSTYTWVAGGCGSAYRVCSPAHGSCNDVSAHYYAGCNSLTGRTFIAVSLVNALFSPLCGSHWLILAQWRLELGDGEGLDPLGSYTLPLVIDNRDWDTPLPSTLTVDLIDCAEVPCAPQVIITITPDGETAPDCETFTWDYTQPGDCDCEVTLVSTTDEFACFHIECADESTEDRCIPRRFCPPNCDSWDTCDSEGMAGAFGFSRLVDYDDTTGGTDPGTGGTYTAMHWTYENLNGQLWGMVGTEPRNPGTTCEGSGTISAGAYTVWANLGTQGDYNDPGILIRYLDFTYAGGLHSEHYVYAICVAVECNDGRASIVRFLLAIQNFTGSDDEVYGPWPPTSATIDDNCYEIGDLDTVEIDSVIHGDCTTDFMATSFNFDNFLSGGGGGANMLLISGIMGPSP